LQRVLARWRAWLLVALLISVGDAVSVRDGAAASAIEVIATASAVGRVTVAAVDSNGVAGAIVVAQGLTLGQRIAALVLMRTCWTSAATSVPKAMAPTRTRWRTIIASAT
jgi:hypothetical protein